MKHFAAFGLEHPLSKFSSSAASSSTALLLIALVAVVSSCGKEAASPNQKETSQTLKPSLARGERHKYEGSLNNVPITALAEFFQDGKVRGLFYRNDQVNQQFLFTGTKDESAALHLRVFKEGKGIALAELNKSESNRDAGWRGELQYPDDTRLPFVLGEVVGNKVESKIGGGFVSNSDSKMEIPQVPTDLQSSRQPSLADPAEAEISAARKVRLRIVTEPKVYMKYGWRVEGLGWGLIDGQGKIVVEPKWDDVFTDSLDKGIVLVDHGGKMSLIGRDGHIMSPVQWDAIANVSEGLLAVRDAHKWGYLDVRGKSVVKPTWDDAGSFSDGLARVKRDNAWGYIDRTGKIVIDPVWTGARDFREGFAEVSKKNVEGDVIGKAKWGYIDRHGSIIVEPQFDEMESYLGHNLIQIRRDRKIGFMRRDGRIVSQPQWDEVDVGGSRGLVPVRSGGKWGYIDDSGKLVSQVQWDRAYAFSYGLAKVKKVSWGCIDETGRVVIDPNWDDIKTSDFFVAVKKSGKWGLRQRPNYTKIAGDWDEIEFVASGGAPTDMQVLHDSTVPEVRVKSGPGWGLVDATGTVMVEPVWDELKFLKEGRLPVRRGAYWGVVDTGGQVWVEPQWDYLETYSEGVALVQRGKRWGYIDIYGKVVIDLAWDDAAPFQDGFAKVVRGGEFGHEGGVDSGDEGIIDHNGRIVVEPAWTDIDLHRGEDGKVYFYCIQENGQVAWFSSDGTEIWHSPSTVTSD